ncbi:MAG: ATP-dependent zinc metalloprotease FtsH [Clostridia bacterium]|nr:ATP-dependent zinc metalloprotease FtsH [Clostridia bacterium]
MKNGDKIKAFLPYIIIPLIVVLLISFSTSDTAKNSKLEYYQVIELFDKGEVVEYELNIGSGNLTFKLKDGTSGKYSVPNVSLFVDDIHEAVVEYNRANPKAPIKYNYVSGNSYSMWISLLPAILCGAIAIFGGIYFIKKMNNSISSENNRAMGFGKARVKFGKDEKRKTTFKEVAGADEEKEELQEIVEFLRDPRKFTELGARIPKGVLLVGPPGTGKTLLARAVAGEADVPFFSISGSDFVEMYVGVGASRVRDLFDQAKKSAPSIIFIDEIDAVGRHRGAGMGGGHDEREQTLNQLLVEMDGFGNNEGIIIIAATNRPDILDPALLRPGRFDRQVTVGRPDLKGREEILKVHSKNKPLAPDVDLKTVAHGTIGFVGADLENLMNEAALLAAKRNKKAITMTEIDEAVVKVEVGTEKKSHKYTEKDKKMTAYHEAGHAVVAYYLENSDPVYEISIIPRGMAGGYTLYRPDEDSSFASKTEMIEDIISLMGGRVAEKIIGNDISTGPSSDISRASDIARGMVTRYGMSEKLGPVVYGKDNDQVFLGMDYNHTKNYSEAYATQIDDEIKRIVLDCEKKCRDILEEHNDKLVLVAETLIKREKIDRDLFLKLMDENYSPDEDVEETVETEAIETQDTVIEEVAEVIEEDVVENQSESDVASEIITEESDETTD